MAEIVADATNFLGGITEMGLYNPDSQTFQKQNDGAHPRMTAPPNWFPRGVVRLGRMVSDRADGRFRFYFAYNPASVDVGYSVDPEVYDPGIPLPPEMTANSALQGTSNVSFQLMVDRTNEMLDDPTYPGVGKDRMVLEQMFGGVDNTIGRITSTPVDVYFGGKEAWHFYGFATSINISLDHFSQLMVPMRMLVNVTMVRQTRADWTEGNAGGARGGGSYSPNKQSQGATDYRNTGGI